MFLELWCRYKRVVNFVVVGGGVALLGMSQMYFYVDILHLETNLANILQTFISLQINFNLNDRLTWGDLRNDNGNYWNRWMKYHLSRLVSIVLCQGVFTLITHVGLHYMIAFAASIGFGMVINYVTSSRFVFKKEKVNV